MKPQRIITAGLLVAAIAWVGCSHGHRELPEPALIGAFKPELPLFMTGPLAGALTNSGSYSARVSFQRTPGEPPVEGQFLAQGTKFFFAPDIAAKGDRFQRAAGFSYIWDAAKGRGYLLSEGLQAYAPVATEKRILQVSIRQSGAPAGKVAGYACVAEEAAVQMNDQPDLVLKVLRATDPAGLPVQATTVENLPMVLTLSHLRAEPIQPELFVPPSDFTRYESAAALADELAMRQRSFRKGKGPAVIPDSL